MDTKNKKKATANPNAQFRWQSKVAESVVSVVNNLIKWAGLVLIAYFSYKSIDTLAGQRTTADIGINFLTDIKISSALAGAFGVSGIAYGLGQRKLRRDTVERLQARNKELELRLDPGRSTSQLTPRGETRPEDQ